MKYVSVCVVAAAVALLWAGAARAEREAEYANPGPDAQPRPQPRRSPPARPGLFAAGSIAAAKRMSVEQREEWRFLKDAAAASRFEGEASRLALARSQDAAVRSFASALIEHHGASGAELQHLLRGRGMAPPMLGNSQRKVLNRLAKLNGKKFDREYMDDVGLRQHQQDLQAYERAAAAVADPALKAWIARTLPTLQYHLATAERIAASDTRLAKSAGVRSASRPQPVRGTSAAAQDRPGVPSRLPTQFSGAAPVQTGAAHPVAPGPIGSSSR